MTIERSYNEAFEYTILPATGPGEIVERGNTASLLINIPYLFVSGVFPPEYIIDEILSKGISDAGMSGGVKWEPYKIKDSDFQLILNEVKSTLNQPGLVYVEPDDWVKTFEDWNVWVMYIKHGVPWEEHKRLNDAVVKIEREMAIAEKDDDINRIYELHIKYVEE